MEKKGPGLWLGSFEAMKSPCELWVETPSQEQAEDLTRQVAEEAWRIEEKYSRFLPESVIGQINASQGSWVNLDQETKLLMRFADESWHATGGLLDITIGGFMRLWRFDGKTPPPPRSALKKARKLVGWDKVRLSKKGIKLQPGMSLDLGGIGKEYAVDRAAMLVVKQLKKGGIMVNFGGDINAIRSRLNGQPWRVGIEAVKPDQEAIPLVINLLRGGIATSGHTKRYAVDAQGKVLGHVLNPRTGWPVAGGPATATVISGVATQAGVLSTCALLKGRKAEDFLKEQGVRYFVQWP